MSESQRYYYIKLKENYFDQDNIKILESMKNGHTYSLIIIKMYLKACKYDGQLMMTTTIAYDPDDVGILASVLNHDVDHVKEAIRAGIKLDLISIIDGREIWMTEIQNMIGQSSTEADRIREYRKKIDNRKILPGVQMYDECTPELEIEKEKELKREEEPSFSIKNELNPNTQDATSRIEELRQYWNTKGIKPIKTVMVMNPRDLLPTLSVCDNDMIKKAMDNYYGIGKSPGHDLFPDNYSFEGFIQGGIDRFCDESDPWEKCKKKEKYHEQTSEERAAILQSLAEQQEKPEPVKEPEHVEPIQDLPTDYEPPRFDAQEIMARLRKQAGGRI